MEGNADEIADRSSRRGETRCWGDLSLSAPPIVATLPRIRRTIGMSRIHPECPDSDPSDRSLAADVVFDKRQMRRRLRHCRIDATLPQ
jgi:hypothetical protein